ncbi:unnamed protein product [Protopolystoma xenopodis]|uniref:Uncharacterized protein n=1 Tax=Protopolystoma xenopodis TaxID=117903 RepID=A0A3S5A1Z2_9PLAT|nr:unnamed protein product [Protopolystoma xenopodis]
MEQLFCGSDNFPSLMTPESCLAPSSQRLNRSFLDKLRSIEDNLRDARANLATTSQQSSNLKASLAFIK